MTTKPERRTNIDLDVAASARARGERGDTLIEILMALMVLSIAAVALMIAFSTSISASAEHRQLATANEIVGDVSQQVISAIEANSSYFTCTTNNASEADAIAYVWPLIESDVSIPSSYGTYTASLTGYEWWNGNSFINTCYPGEGPEEITMSVTAGGHSFSNTFVVNLPSGNENAVTDLSSGVAGQLVFSSQEPESGTGEPGVVFSPQPLVSVLDTNNQLVTTDLSPVVLSIESGPSGATLSGCTADDPYGEAQFSGCTISGSAGTYVIVATVVGQTLESDPDGQGLNENPVNILNSTFWQASPNWYSTTFTVTVSGNPDKIKFQPAPVPALSGATLTTQPTIEIISPSSGSPDPSANGTLTLALSGGSLMNCTGDGATTSDGGQLVTATAVRGVVTLANCTFSGAIFYNDVASPAGPDPTTYALTASYTGAVSATTSMAVTGPGAAAQLIFSKQPSGVSNASSASTAFYINPQVTIEDAFGNPEYNLPTSTKVILAYSSSSAVTETLGGCTQTMAVYTGIEQYANCSGNKYGGPLYFTATYGTLPVITSNSFDISADAESLEFATQPVAGASGDALATQPVVDVIDGKGLLDTGWTGNSITISVAAISALGGNLSYCTDSSSYGVFSFSTCQFSGLVGQPYYLSVSLVNSEGQTITANSAQISPASAGSPAILAYTTAPVAGAAGSLLTTQPVLKVEDSAGNVVTSSSATIALSTSGGILSGPCTNLSAVTGVFNVENCSFGGLVGETYGLTATSSGLASATDPIVPTAAGPMSPYTSTVFASPTSVVDNGTSSSTVWATLLDSYGNPVANKAISLSAGGGSSVITPVSNITNGSGQATFTVTDTAPETVTYTATDVTDSVPIMMTASVIFTGPTSAANSTVSANPGTQTANGTSASIVTVTLLDVNNNPVVGESVSLSAGGGSSVITTLSGTSNENGQATFSVTDTKAETVTYSASDTTENVAITQTASVIFVAGPASATNSTISSNPGTQTANGTSTSTVTVTLLDANGNPVSGKTVTLARSGTTSQISAASGPSSAAGVVTFTVTDTKAETVTYTARDATDGVTLTSTASVIFVAGPVSATNSTISSNPGTQTANGTSTSLITVTLKDANGNPVSGKTVTLARSGTTSQISAASGPSSAAGVVTFTVTDTKAETVTYTATDTTDGVTLTSTASVIFVAGPASATNSTISSNPGTQTANGTSTSTVTVTLLDANGNPVSGKTVTLARSGTTSQISAASGPSSAAGVVTFTVTDTKAETVTYTARDATDGVTLTSTASVIFVAGPVSATNSTISSNPGTQTANGTSTSLITVTLKDANGNPVSGKTVTLARSGTTSQISAASGPSSAAGVVTFTVTDTKAETVTYTATDTTDGVTLTSTASVIFVAGPASATKSTVTVSPASVPANGSSTSTVTVTMLDANSNPENGDTVTLTGTGSSVVSPASGVTNASGVVTFTVSDNVVQVVTLTATDTTDSVTASTKPTVSFTSDPTSASKSTAVANPVTQTANGTSTSLITVTLLDANSLPEVGDTVTLTGTGSSAIATSPSVTNANGVVTFTVTDTTAQLVTYTATDTTDSVTVSTKPTVNFVAGPVSTATSTVTANPGTQTANGTSTSTVTVTLLDANGNPVSGKTVTLARSGTTSQISAASGPSSAAGVVTFTVTDTKAETVTYTARDATDGVTLTSTASVIFVAGPASATKSTVTVSPASVPANGSSTSTVTVTMLDANSNPENGDTVTLTGTGSSVVSPASGVTNASGVVTFTVSDNVVQVVTLTATDTTDSVTASTKPTVSFTSDPTSASKSTAVANPVTQTANGTSTSLITVTLLDANSLPEVGDTVTLTGTGSSAIATSPSVTNANGVVTFTVTDTTAQLVTYTATDTTDSVTVSTKPTVNFVAGPASATKSTVTVSPASVPANGSSTSTVTVTMLDANSNPENGDTVTLTGTGSSVVSPASGVTNASGVVTFTVSDNVVQVVTLTATDTTDSVTASTKPTVSFTSDPTSASKSTVLASPTSVLANGISNSTITVTLLDPNNFPEVGDTVTLVGTGSSVISTSPSVTNANGQATFNVVASTAQTDVYTAKDTTDNVGITQTASVTYTTDSASASNSTVVASPTSVETGGTSTVTVTIFDTTYNPIAGKSVSLSCTNSGSSNGPSVTNSSGQATFTVTDSKAKTPVCTATDVTDSNLVLTHTATITFTNRPSAPSTTISAANSTAVASPSSVLANGASSSTITVSVYDANYNPIAGKTVTLTANNGTHSTITTISPTSGANGQASFSVTDNSVENVTYTATASGTTLATVLVTFTSDPVSVTASTVEAVPTLVTDNGLAYTTITVTLLDAGCNPIANKSVTLTVSAGTHSTITTVSAVTNANGQATFTVSDLVAENVTYTAKDTTDSLTITQTATVTFDA